MADNTEEITLDHVFNTGANADRNPTTTPPVEDTSKPIDKPVDTTPVDNPPKDTPPVTPTDTTIDTEENKNKVKSLLSTFSSTDGLNETNVSIREQLLSKYKGESFDAEGNILDKDGKIVKAFEDVFKDISTKEPTLDEKGNEIDADGKIVKTKAELLAEKSVVNKLHHLSEYEFLDDKGETKVYSDDDKGLEEFTNDLVEAKFEDYKTRYFSQNPVLLEVAKHLLLGKSLETFRQAVDYSKIDKKSLSTEEKLAYIRQSFEVKNLDKKMVDSVVQLIKDGNTVDKDFDTAIDTLKAHDEAQKAARSAEYQEQARLNQERVTQHWNTVQDMIKTNKAKFVAIPKEEQDAFYNYMANAVDDKGNSQNMLDASTSPLDEQIGLAYLRYKKFNFDKVINQRVNEQRVSDLTKLIARSANLKETPAGDDTKTKSPSNVEISISTLLGQ